MKRHKKLAATSWPMTQVFHSRRKGTKLKCLKMLVQLLLKA